MGNEAIRLLLLSIAALVLLFVLGSKVTSDGASLPTVVAAVAVIGVAIYFVGRGIGGVLKDNSSAP